MNDNVNKCIKHNRWRQSHGSVTGNIKKNEMNTDLLLNWILVFRSGYLFWGEIQLLVPKMECHHHHSGNRAQISHAPLCLVSRFFLAAFRSQSIRGWPVHQAAFLSDRGTTGKFQLLPLLFAPSPSSSVYSVVPSVQVVTV